MISGEFVSVSDLKLGLLAVSELVMVYEMVRRGGRLLHGRQMGGQILPMLDGKVCSEEEDVRETCGTFHAGEKGGEEDGVEGVVG